MSPEQKTTPLVSIIIVNYKTPQLVIDCIKSLYAYENKITYEIIVLDNYSQDQSIQLIKDTYPQIVVVESSKNLGFAGGNNKAAQTATGQYLLFLNSDTLITKPFLKSLIVVMESNKKIGIIGPRLRNKDHSLQESVFRFPTLWRAFCESFFLCNLFPRSKFFGDYRKFTYSDMKQVDYLSGACFLIDKLLFNTMQGFDEKFFMYAEEADLAFRLYKKGFRSYFLPAGDIIHLGKGSWKDQADFNPLFFLSQVIYHRKHYGNWGLKFFLIVKIKGYFLRNIALSFKLNFKKIRFHNQIISFYARQLF
ncbi:MAG: glycosyltransferase family 2 protein [Candidatus Margulisbacteria bacterium]|nr:glycosyltransferase family 2 protein [Candidatus Margulisiibacteriota bacterium]